MNNATYIETDPGLWTGRIDSNGDERTFRWHQVVKCVSLKDLDKRDEVALLGFGCDIGVAKNKGRIGAAAAPNHFRSTVGNLSWRNERQGFIDVGTIHPNGFDLDEAHIQLGKAVSLLLNHNKKPIVIGGGHETAFGHYL